MAKSRESMRAPQFVRYFGPVLAALQELGGSGRPEEVRTRIVQALKLSEHQQTDPLPSGVSRFDNQVHWARFYLSKAGYIDSSRHGVWSLTEKSRGIGALTSDQATSIFRSVVSQFAKQRREKLAQGTAANEGLFTVLSTSKWWRDDGRNLMKSDGLHDATLGFPSPLRGAACAGPALGWGACSAAAHARGARPIRPIPPASA
jgi:hypothetical protein